MPRSRHQPVKKVTNKAKLSAPVEPEKKKRKLRHKTGSIRNFRKLNRSKYTSEPILTEKGIKDSMLRALEDHDRSWEEGGCNKAYGSSPFEKTAMGRDVVHLVRDTVESIWVNKVMERLRESFRNSDPKYRHVTITHEQIHDAFMASTAKFSHEIKTMYNVLTEGGKYGETLKAEMRAKRKK